MSAPIGERDLARLQECLAGDGIVVIPTDTVYGLACNPDSERAIRRLYELKRRPPTKPAAVMFFALDPALRALPELGPRTRVAMAALLPGPVTLLLSNPRERYPLVCDPARFADGMSGGAHRRGAHRAGACPAPLGVRVPSLSGPLAALVGVSVPAMQSSANLAGGPDPRLLSDVPDVLCEGADLVLDGGELPGVASTVIDLSEYEQGGAWRIVREGPLDEEDIAAALA